MPCRGMLWATIARSVLWPRGQGEDDLRTGYQGHAVRSDGHVRRPGQPRRQPSCVACLSPSTQQALRCANPALSALAGATQVVRKFGMAAVPHPFLAAAVTATSSFVVSVLTLWYVEKSQETWKMNRQCFWWFLAAGVTISLGMTCIYYALDLGKVSVVIPISSTGPFFSLIFAALFLRDVERVTLRIVLSAAMIIGGVVLITLWK